MTAVGVGERVSVRYRLPAAEIGARADAPTMSDAVGEVVDLTPDAVVIATRRRGLVSIDLTAVVTVKRVPPPPQRRDRRSESADPTAG